MSSDASRANSFSGYEQDFHTLQSAFNKTIDSIASASNTDKRKNAIQSAERELGEVNELLVQMEREVMNAHFLAVSVFKQGVVF
ncbi:unnamed protein product [Absidia cylindrospora]